MAMMCVVFPYYIEPKTKWITAPQSRQIQTLKSVRPEDLQHEKLESHFQFSPLGYRKQKQAETENYKK